MLNLPLKNLFLTKLELHPQLQMSMSQVCKIHIKIITFFEHKNVRVLSIVSQPAHAKYGHFKRKRTLTFQENISHMYHPAV